MQDYRSIGPMPLFTLEACNMIADKLVRDVTISVVGKDNISKIKEKALEKILRQSIYTKLYEKRNELNPYRDTQKSLLDKISRSLETELRDKKWLRVKNKIIFNRIHTHVKARKIKDIANSMEHFQNLILREIQTFINEQKLSAVTPAPTQPISNPYAPYGLSPPVQAPTSSTYNPYSLLSSYPVAPTQPPSQISTQPLNPYLPYGLSTPIQAPTSTTYNPYSSYSSYPAAVPSPAPAPTQPISNPYLSYGLSPPVQPPTLPTYNPRNSVHIPYASYPPTPTPIQPVSSGYSPYGFFSPTQSVASPISNAGNNAYPYPSYGIYPSPSNW